MMELIVLTPEATLLEIGGVERIRIPLTDGGSLGIHPGHHPLLAETREGRVEYGEEEYTESIQLRAGILRVAQNRATIYTSGWSGVSETQPDPAPDRLEKALRELEQGLEGRT